MDPMRGVLSAGVVACVALGSATVVDLGRIMPLGDSITEGTGTPQVGGYRGRHGETGELIEPKTGAELMDFIEQHAWESEAAVVEDLYRAVTDRSHLERALGECSASRSGGSIPATPASGGPAPDAEGPTTSTTRTDLPRPTYVAPGDATGATA